MGGESTKDIMFGPSEFRGWNASYYFFNPVLLYKFLVFGEYN